MRAVAAGRRLGRADRRRPLQRGRAHRAAGRRSRCAAPHLEEVAAGRRLAGRVGRRPGARRGRAGARRARRRRADPRRRQDLLLGRRRAARRARACARDGDGPPRRLRRPLGEGVEIDRAWFAGAGMRASESHLVRFHGARVHALLGGPDELLREPWFGRDAIRTAASWAGIADAAARRGARGARAARARRRRPRRPGRRAHRHRTRRRSTCGWPRPGAARTPTPSAAMRALSVHLREAVARAAQALVDEALRAAGSRPLARGGALDRAAPRPAHLPAPAPPRPAARARRTRGGRPVTLEREHFEARYARRPRPVGLRDERLRARRSTSARWRRSATAATARALRGGLLDRRLHRDARRSLRRAARRRHRAGRGRRRARAPGRARPRPRRAPHAARSEWPAGPFDLVVCSELLYYWDRPTLEAALAVDRRLAGPRRAPGRRPLPPAVEHRPADRRRRPRAAARAPRPWRTSSAEANDHFRIDVFDA